MKYIANAVEADVRVILDVGPKLSDGSLRILLGDRASIDEPIDIHSTAESLIVDAAMISRYVPVRGDYYVVQADGYAYVNPKEVLERKYRPAPAPQAPEPTPVLIGFTLALSRLHAGEKVRDCDSMTKGMYVAFQPGYPDGIPINANTAKATGQPEGTLCKFQPYLMLRNADGSYIPWAPSIAQVLSHKWTVVEEPAAESAA